MRAKALGGPGGCEQSGEGRVPGYLLICVLPLMGLGFWEQLEGLA